MIRNLLYERSLRRYLDEMVAVCLHDNLTFDSLHNKKTAQELAAKWGSFDIPTLYGTMKWLLQEGYRAEFARSRHFLSTFPEADRKAFIDSLPESDPRRRKLAVVERTWGRLPEDGIAAFDYAWCVVLAIIGSTLQMTSGKSTYIEYGSQAAAGVQSAYSGWSEYLFAYTAGAEFSGRFAKDAFFENNEAYYLRLLYSWQQPANKVDWNLSLRRE